MRSPSAKLLAYHEVALRQKQGPHPPPAAVPLLQRKKAKGNGNVANEALLPQEKAKIAITDPINIIKERDSLC